MPGAEKEKLVIILGPTASGKTELAVRLAERFDGEIVNADSVQVYRGMDIGTAKPSAELRQRVAHHLIDIVSPASNFSASDFRREAAGAIADIMRRGKKVFVVGGTGLYIRALLQGLVDSPSGDDDIRKELSEEADRKGESELLGRLSAVDPVTAARLHPNDRVRIIRALEVYQLTGRPISQFRHEHGFTENHYLHLKIGITVERQDLYRRIERRVEQMMGQGLVREVSELLEGGYDAGSKAMRSIGYRQICSFINGDYDLAEAVRLIKRDTRRYAKRQITWFKLDDEINWVEYPDSFATICKNVIEFFD